MSNTDAAPDEVACAASPFAGVLHPREVPLGGPRAIRVRRTLPQRERSLIGAWCFADHYGPHDVGRHRRDGRAPAPAHRAADGELAVQRRGRAPRQRRRARHGAARRAQPDDRRARASATPRCRPRPRRCCTACSCGWPCPTPHRDTATATSTTTRPPAPSAGGARCGSSSASSPARTRRCTPSHRCSARSSTSTPARQLTLDVDPTFEHGVLLDQGSGRGVRLGTRRSADLWPTRAPGHRRLHLANRGDGPARAVLLGGAPFDEQLVMWWNFVGRSHDDIVDYREQWQNHDDRFGAVDGLSRARRHDCPRRRCPTPHCGPGRNPRLSGYR